LGTAFNDISEKAKFSTCGWHTHFWLDIKEADLMKEFCSITFSDKHNSSNENHHFSLYDCVASLQGMPCKTYDSSVEVRP
jgi:hypothetical protein